MYHQPASVIPASNRFQVDSSEPNRITTCAMIAVATARTTITPSATTDSRRRIASAFAASSLTASPAGTTPDARNLPRLHAGDSARRRSRRVPAEEVRTGKRLRITGSRSKVTATRSPKAWPATRDRSTKRHPGHENQQQDLANPPRSIRAVEPGGAGPFGTRGRDRRGQIHVGPPLTSASMLGACQPGESGGVMELSRTSKSSKQNRLAVNADPFTVMRCWAIVLSITSNAVAAPRTENSKHQCLVPRSNEDLIALHHRMISQPCPGVFRMNRNRISAPPFITVGAVLGHIAAHESFHIPPIGRRAKRAGRPRRAGSPASQLFRGLEQVESTGHGGPGHSLDGGPGPGGLRPEGSRTSSSSWATTSWFNIGVIHRGMTAGKTPPLDRLASRASSSPTITPSRAARRAGGLHHRPVADPHRADHRGPGRAQGWNARHGADHRHGAFALGYATGQSARTTWAT